ncbi:Superfamily I DNA helicase [Alloactinosynnema sp. L-07]|uniref:AAA domain-containing protein n=1 Tax=Alloactinosynnema sp. L-07 TaxID=1653480 RepID=UPI00065EFE37|nr:AAA domain-containing protein [Alloactinosynnema sp. L-07]CRK61198.1 Superfamily I DNA helicase [Alloactinosynnema sp. L-07]
MQEQRGVSADIIQKARSLFQFLAQAQAQRTKPVRMVENYESALWWHSTPEHPAIEIAGRRDAPRQDDPILLVRRVPREHAPEPNPELRVWLVGDLDKPTEPPRLRTTITEPDPDQPADEEAGQPLRRIDLADRPDIQDAHRAWSRRWESWAERELIDRPAREFYQALFGLYMKATGHPEELELVLGVGLLSWLPENHSEVQRHLFTTPVAVQFDDDTATLTVERVDAPDGARLETDMLDPALTTSPLLAGVREDASAYRDHPLDHESVGALVQRAVHILDRAGGYADDLTVPAPDQDAVAVFAPALVLRRRSQQGLIDIYNTIVAQITESGQVPGGVIPLVDPNHEPTVPAASGDGALVMVEDEPFLPLPVNDKQLQILRKVDASAHTLVQGPPGTGKTHTAAALLSHLLAQGKRVLVTAQTDRALKEVRDKLPEEIKPLAVSVVGSSREDMADLKVAVNKISDAAANHDADRNQADIRQALEEVDRLERLRAQLRNDLLTARTAELDAHERAGYSGTLAAIAQQHQAQASSYGWVTEMFQGGPDTPAPLDGDEIRELRAHLTDTQFLADKGEAQLRLVKLDNIPEPAVFARQLEAERAAHAHSAGYASARADARYAGLRALSPRQRRDIRAWVNEIGGRVAALARRPEPWLPTALHEAITGHGARWVSRDRQISELIGRCRPLVALLGPMDRVAVAGNIDQFRHMAETLRAHVAKAGPLKVDAGGHPKIGLTTSKVVKQSASFFTGVAVNGLPATTEAQLTLFIAWAQASAALDALDRAWPENTVIPAEDTVQERLTWHVTESEQLRAVLVLGHDIDQRRKFISTMPGVAMPAWENPHDLAAFSAMIEAADAEDAAELAAKPVTLAIDTLAAESRWDSASPAVKALSQAAADRDQNSYATAYERVRRLLDVRAIELRTTQLNRKLIAGAPALARSVTENPADAVWDARLREFDQAWRWAAVARWITDRTTVDVNAIQAEINQIEDRLRRAVEHMAATRAWGHAVSKERLSREARADLVAYSQAVKRVGRGGGKYAAQKRAEVREAMDRCRGSVPVWIMPIYRIADQVRISPDMFDVVVVDEASQAGMEAMFLQYLAPKMAIIGDDKQVSPAAVGVDQQMLRDLANTWIPHDKYKANWQDPKRSLFEEARMRYGEVITLTEHRRCMPEIIGFSNKIAYAPDGISLVPVRQYGLDRLDPVKPVFVPDGYTRGDTNPAEVDAIVDQIEKCLGDPAYDGKTFGVISLRSGRQVAALEKALLDRIPENELIARDLRCGESADFQGSERDVMFLSMVNAPDPDKRLMPLTTEMYAQRYNVAASRAKDQMWVFHSIPLGELRNTQDLRFRLLDYCYGVSARTRDEDLTHPNRVSDDIRTAPFDSLFEQRVFNKLIDQGYIVHPQYEVMGFRIDMVVLGASGRLAIECDGDHWHGPEQYAYDTARQRELERLGWTFFRIRESDFYIDQAAVLDELWSALHEHEIHPSGWMPPEPEIVPTPAPEPAPVATLPTPEVQTVDDEPQPEEDEHVVEDFVARAVVAEILVPAAPAARARLPRPVVRPYTPFLGSNPPVSDSRPLGLAEGLVAIVAVEGPMLIGRLHSVYVQSSGGQRVGHNIAATLNQAIENALRRGLLVSDNPLYEREMRSMTVRLPDQPKAIIRKAGPRDFDLIPPAELSELITGLAHATGRDHGDALHGETLRELGLVRLTQSVRARFDAVVKAIGRSL